MSAVREEWEDTYRQGNISDDQNGQLNDDNMTRCVKFGKWSPTGDEPLEMVRSRGGATFWHDPWKVQVSGERRGHPPPEVSHLPSSLFVALALGLFFP